MRYFLMACGLTTAAALVSTPALVTDLMAPLRGPDVASNASRAMAALEAHSLGEPLTVALGPLRDLPPPKPDSLRNQQRGKAEPKPETKPAGTVSDLAPAAGAARAAARAREAAKAAPVTAGRVPERSEAEAAERVQQADALFRDNWSSAPMQAARTKPTAYPKAGRAAARPVLDAGSTGDRAAPVADKPLAEMALSSPMRPTPRKDAQTAEAKTETDGGRGVYVVIGSFAKPGHADLWVRKHDKWQPSVLDAVVEGRARQRVVVGPFAPDQAKDALGRIKAAGIKDAWPLKAPAGTTRGLRSADSLG